MRLDACTLAMDGNSADLVADQFIRVTGRMDAQRRIANNEVSIQAGRGLRVTKAPKRRRRSLHSRTAELRLE
jgi:hypothetical protein